MKRALSTLAERIYRTLLRLYPRRFRDEFEDDLVRAYRDRVAEDRHRGPLGRLRLLIYLAADFLTSLVAVHAHDPTATSFAHGPGSRATLADSVPLDLRHALRSYRRDPVFALPAFLTLAVGMGAATAMFSIADGITFQALPYAEPDRLVVAGPGRERPGLTSPADFREWRERASTITVAAALPQQSTLRGDDGVIEVSGVAISPDFFEVLGVERGIGRAFLGADHAADAPPTALLGHGLWTRRFGADPSVLGRPLELNGRLFTVVGVLPSDFVPPEALTLEGAQVWYPLAHSGTDLTARTYSLRVLGRLSEGVSVQAPHEELQAIQSALQAERSMPDVNVTVAPLHEVTVAAITTPMRILLAAVGLLVLMTLGNVANLVLLRSARRAREASVRSALGASRGRQIRRALTEGLLLSSLSGVAAVLVAVVAVGVVQRVDPGGIPRLAEVGVDARALGFAALLSFAVGLLLGLIPVARRTGTPVLLDRGTADRTGSSRRLSATRTVLVAGQVALAANLLIGAGLLVNSFVRLNNTDLGFEAEDAAWLELSLPTYRRVPLDERTRLYESVLLRLGEIDAVDVAGGGDDLPFAPDRRETWASREGLTLDDGENPPRAGLHRVTPGFFEALGTSLLGGRAFTATDRADSEPVAIVNGTFARAQWPGQSPLGRRLRLGHPTEDTPWMTVVGVVDDVREAAPSAPVQSEVYIPWMQAPTLGMSIVVRGGADPGTLLPALRRAVREVDPALPVDRAGTLADHVAAHNVEPRFYMLLLTSFAGVALVLVAVGVYGTMAYAVQGQRHALGVRLALGATRTRVLVAVLRQGAVIMALGLAVGCGVALLGGRILEAHVFEITPTDPPTLFVMTAFLAMIGLAASWFPARRAASTEVVDALRVE